MVYALCVAVAVLIAPALCEAQPIYAVDTAHVPHVKMWWTTAEGEEVVLEADHPYSSEFSRTYLGANVECYVTVGGTRIDMGCGHPEGLEIRVGFYKHNGEALFFKGLPGDGVIHVEVSNVLGNKPGRVIDRTTFQQLKYTKEDIAACGLDRHAESQFNTVDARETLLGQLTKENTRMGSLDGAPGHGSVEFVQEEDGTLTMRADIPYRLMRHLQDPWVRTTPGVFLEPYRFHIEFEMLPKGVEPRPLMRPELPD